MSERSKDMTATRSGEQTPALTRRGFLHMVGAAGGAAAVHETLVALGLMRHPAAWAGPPVCRPGSGDGKTVAVLGSGVGGLAIAHMLAQCGYRCTVLEAQDRIGGRSHTGRRGSKVREVKADGSIDEQIVDIDENPRPDGPFYINLGPGRLPFHHRRILELCKDLEVPLEVYVHTADNNLHWMKGMTDPVVRNRLYNDSEGYIAELLAKAINQRALDHELDEEDREKLLGLLQEMGALDGRFRYRGSTRSGCRVEADVKDPCRYDPSDALAPLALDEILESSFWDPCRVGAPRGEDACNPSSYHHGFYQNEDYLWQTTSFQPVGGMDVIVMKLEEALEALGVEIRTDSPVKRVAREGGKVVVAVEGGPAEGELFDLCVCNIPMTVLKDIELPDHSREYVHAVCRRTGSASCKVGWQAERRFWEEENDIYGGISWIEHPITQMWYPSNDYFANKGTLTGAYNYGRTAVEFGHLSPPARLDLAYAGGALLHPAAFSRRGDVIKERGVSIAWHKVQYIKGCAMVWNSASDQDRLDYIRLLAPELDGRFFMVGDQVSTLPGWQEGALMSAEHVFRQITRGEDTELEQLREEIDAAPMTLDVMG